MQASSKGHPGAFYQLGRYYDKELILNQNYTQAMECYKLAAERGDVEGRYQIGCASGEIIQSNPKRGFQMQLKPVISSQGKP